MARKRQMGRVGVLFVGSICFGHRVRQIRNFVIPHVQVAGQGGGAISFDKRCIVNVFFVCSVSLGGGISNVHDFMVV